MLHPAAQYTTFYHHSLLDASAYIPSGLFGLWNLPNRVLILTAKSQGSVRYLLPEAQVSTIRRHGEGQMVTLRGAANTALFSPARNLHYP